MSASIGSHESNVMRYLDDVCSSEACANAALDAETEATAKTIERTMQRRAPCRIISSSRPRRSWQATLKAEGHPQGRARWRLSGILKWPDSHPCRPRTPGEREPPCETSRDE